MLFKLLILWWSWGEWVCVCPCEREIFVCYSAMTSPGCKPHWFSKAGVLGAFLSVVGHKDWGACCGAHTPHSSGRFAFVRFLLIVGCCARGKVFGEITSLPLQPSYPTLCRLFCVPGKRWVQDLLLLPSWTIFLTSFLTFAHRQVGCKALIGWIEQKSYKIIFFWCFLLTHFILFFCCVQCSVRRAINHCPSEVEKYVLKPLPRFVSYFWPSWRGLM